MIGEAQKSAGRIPLGGIVLSTRQWVLALEPHKKGISTCNLRTHDEVRKADEIFGPISDAKTDAAMISIAEKINKQQEGEFDPSQFVGLYEEALKKLIADKKNGHNPVTAAEPEETNVVDLMSTRRASLQGRSGGGGGGKGATPAPAKREDSGGVIQKAKPKRGGRRDNLIPHSTKL